MEGKKLYKELLCGKDDDSSYVGENLLHILARKNRFREVSEMFKNKQSFQFSLYIPATLGSVLVSVRSQQVWDAAG